jgi:uncharacterized protein
MMLPSNYLKIYPYNETQDQLILFSTMQSSKILVKKETWEAMERQLLSPENEIVLQKLGMIVEDRDEEKRAVSCHFEELNKTNTGLDIIVVLNMDCNFACKYCYEGDMKGRIYMSEGTAARLIDFIRKRFTEDKRVLHLDFFGGEPLLSLGLIKEISGQLKEFVEERNASYTFGLVTNGSLFKKSVAESLVPLGLKNVKITLDGPAHIHNKNRPFKSGTESFETLIKNVIETCDLARIAIGGNFESNNYREFPLLLDYLIDEGLTPDKITRIKFDPVMKKSGRVLSPMDLNEGCMSINEPWIMEASIFLREEILKRGYRTPGIRPMFCMVDSDNSYVVNYDGMLYKCPGLIGMKGFEAGDLEKGPADYSSSYKSDIWKNSKCIECEYLPLCFGGCRFVKFVRDGRMDSLDCQKEYFDACLETLVKQDIKYGLRADE